MHADQEVNDGGNTMPLYPKVSIVLRAIFYISTEEEMRKFRFLETLESELPNLKNLLRARRLAPNDVDVILSDAIHGLVTRKDHNKFGASGVKAALRRAVLWQAHKYYRDNIQQAAKTVPLAEPSEDQTYAYALNEDRELSEDECPFCFVGLLNVHGACHLCNTIVPRRAAVPRPQQKMEDLSVIPQLEMTTDVRRALDKIEPHARMVIEAVIMGNDSLESLSALTGTEKTVLWRSYTRAFEQLKIELGAYQPRRKGKHGAIRVPSQALAGSISSRSCAEFANA